MKCTCGCVTALPATNSISVNCVLQFTRVYRSEECLHLEKIRDIMLQADLEEVTSRQLRMQLEKEVSMELSEYKGFLDQEMLRILGQINGETIRN